MDAQNYVAAYGSGYVCLVGGKWYGPPGCTLVAGIWPPPAAAIWPTLDGAANCYNSKYGTTPPPTQQCNTGYRWDSAKGECVPVTAPKSPVNQVALFAGVAIAGVLLIKVIRG